MYKVAWLTAALLFIPSFVSAAECTSNLLIVLDRSCSMKNTIKDPMTGMSKRKWDIATTAITKLTTKYNGKLQFGLSMFPDKHVTGAMCTQGANAIPPTSGNEQMITALLGMTQPDGPCVTNIDEAARRARDEPAFKDMMRRSFVLLVTDGMQSGDCNGGPAKADPLTVGYLKDLYDRKVPTYVVGFDAAASASSLDKFADAGGLPDKTGPHHFYLASSETELDQVLDTIGGKVSGTEFGCTGLPCPDNRCLDPGETCVQGTCQQQPRDLSGVATADLSALGGDGGDGTNQVGTGCGCRIGGAGRSEVPGAVFVLLGIAAVGGLLLRRYLRRATRWKLG